MIAIGRFGGGLAREAVTSKRLVCIRHCHAMGDLEARRSLSSSLDAGVCWCIGCEASHELSVHELAWIDIVPDVSPSFSGIESRVLFFLSLFMPAV